MARVEESDPYAELKEFLSENSHIFSADCATCICEFIDPEYVDIIRAGDLYMRLFKSPDGYASVDRNGIVVNYEVHDDVEYPRLRQHGNNYRLEYICNGALHTVEQLPDGRVIRNATRGGWPRDRCRTTDGNVFSYLFNKCGVNSVYIRYGDRNYILPYVAVCYAYGYWYGMKTSGCVEFITNIG